MGGHEMKEQYIFWIQTTDGNIIEWRNLTEAQAIRLNNLTNKHVSWLNVNSFGWGKME
jgi:hypothetical protein